MGRSGLTLLETMVAMTIMSMGLLVLLAGFSQGGRAQAAAVTTTRALFICRGLLDQALVAEDLAEGVTEGSPEDFPEWRYRLEVVPVTEHEGEEGERVYWEVRSTAIWREGGEERSVNLVSYTSPRKSP
jgi:prepilin-type N-terminal cleavage/methylation domain-containing protein